MPVKRPVQVAAIMTVLIAGAISGCKAQDPTAPAHTQRIHPTGLTPPSFRHLLKPLPPRLLRALRTSADLRGAAPPVRDQGRNGSCASNATTNDVYAERALAGARPTEDYAVMYQYVQLTGVNNPNAGTSFGKNLNIEQSQGAVPMSQYHSGATGAMLDDATVPTAADHIAAGGPAITGYSNLWSSYPSGGGQGAVDALKASLDAGIPVLTGFIVTENYMFWRGGAPIQAGGTTVYGGHANLAMAYDTGGIWMLNSWGTSWGVNGWAYVSWSFIAQMVEEGWIITGVTHAGATPTPLPTSAPATPTATIFPTAAPTLTPTPTPTMAPTPVSTPIPSPHPTATLPPIPPLPPKPRPSATPIPANFFPVTAWQAWTTRHRRPAIPYLSHGNLRPIAEYWWRHAFLGRSDRTVCGAVTGSVVKSTTQFSQRFQGCRLTRYLQTGTIILSLAWWIP